MVQSVLDRIPNLEEIERELARRAREQRLLRTLRDCLKRKQKYDAAAHHFQKVKK